MKTAWDIIPLDWKVESLLLRSKGKRGIPVSDVMHRCNLDPNSPTDKQALIDAFVFNADLLVARFVNNELRVCPRDAFWFPGRQMQAHQIKLRMI